MKKINKNLFLTETKSEKGIVDAVKVNYGQTKIGPSTQVDSHR